MAKVWIPDQFDEYGFLEIPGHFEGEDDPPDETGTPKPPIDNPVLPPVRAPAKDEWTKDEMGNSYRIVDGSVEFKDDKGTIFKYDTNKGGFVDSNGNFAGSGNSSLINAVKKFFTKPNGDLDLSKIGLIGGGIAGAMSAGTATTKPTGYQGGIPDLVATQPMLTEPPPGRRPGSGGINYGTGVQYKDSKGNIVSDTSTPIADLYKKATQEGTYNQWNHKYGDIPKPTASAGINNLISGNTGGTDNSALIAQLRALLAARNGLTGGPAAGSGVVNPPVNNGIATGIDPNRPWAKASSDPTIKAAQDALDQLSKTQGTPEQRQAALTNFLHTTKYTPTQLAAASNGQWGVQDLIDQMQGNTNVFNAQTPWSVYSTKADVKGVQDALQKLSQTPGTAAEKQAALTNFLKTTNYTPAQLAKASNGMWSVADLTTQMAGNPVLQQASNAPAAGSPTGGGFVTGGGNTGGEYGAFGGKEGYDKAVADETARRNAEQAKLDKHHVAPDSPFYAAYMAATGEQKNNLKYQDKELAERIARRTAISQMDYGGGFITNGYVMGPNGPIEPNENEVGITVVDANGRNRYQTKAEAAEIERKTQQYLIDHGNIKPDTRTGIDDPNQAQTFVSKPEQPNPAVSNTPVVFGGIQNEPKPTPTPAPVVFGGIQNEPTTPLTGLAALNAAAQKTYGRQLTDFEQQDLSGKSLEDAQSIMQQSMDSWKAAHPQGMAAGGLTNLDHGGFVIPADVVSHFGNGSSSAGLELLAQKMGAKPIKGDGDGMSDSIPAAIDGREKALVANDEAYLSPQMVERLGDGDMDAGSRKLKNMMEQIRKARTGTKEQGKQINPNNFMPGGMVGYAQGGGIKSYAGTDPTGSLVQAGVTGTEQNLSNYAGPAITKMLGKAQALANTPYQAYTGPLTAGASGLQNLAFQNAGNLAPNGGMTTDFAQQAGNMNYTPTTSSFNEGFAQQYMNPYLQASLNPQLDEARRQSEITQQQNNAAMTKAGAFGGGRQAILTSENQRNLGTNQANITGQGYNTAYDKAMAQFNADQNRQMQENQFVNTSKLAGLNTGISGLNTANQMGINNLNTQATLGATQRGIESEGIAADKAQFEEARKDPYSKLQYLQSMFNGLPITAQNYTMSQPSTFTSAAGGATTLAQLLKNLNIGT